MTQSPTISVAMIVLNEEPQLRELLPQLAWADEVVVMNGGSSDQSVEIALQHGCRVLTRRFDNFATQRNYALEQCRGDWVLSLDADERATLELIAELRTAVSNYDVAAYHIRIRSTIFGHAMRFSGTQNDVPIRLVRRGAAEWSGDVHETLQVQGTVGHIGHAIEHRTLPDLSAFLAKMHCYSRLEAQRRVAAGEAPRTAAAWLAPVREVFRRMIWKHGWLDGPYGWAFCLLSGLSAWVHADRHSRLWFSSKHTKTIQQVASPQKPTDVTPSALLKRHLTTFADGVRS